MANNVLQCNDVHLAPQSRFLTNRPRNTTSSSSLRNPICNGISLILPNPKTGKSFHWNVGTSKGLSVLNGSPPVTAQTSGMVVGNKPFTATVKVRRDSVTCLLDGKVLIEHKTDFSNLTSDNFHEIRDKTLVGVACDEPTTFHHVQIVEITGKGRTTR